MILPARVRWDGRWITATVRNISSRGLMIAVSVPPPPGAYLEIQVASQTITARAVWTDQHMCGLLAQGRIDVSALCGGPARRAPDAQDRRSRARPSAAVLAEHNRQWGAAFQFIAALAFAASAAGGIGWEVYKALAAPVTAIETHLSSGE